MPTKAQIARRKYGCALDELTSGEKAAVTREFNRTNGSSTTEPAPVVAPVAMAGYSTVKFGRPGVNGVKECIVKDGTIVSAALEQAGVVINTKKEGILNKAGTIIMLADKVVDGSVYLIVPGVDSSE